MNQRVRLTYILIIAGFILALLPLTGNRSFTGKPGQLLSEVINNDSYFSPDQVARFISSEDSTVQLIDLRDPGSFKKETLPGALSIPFDELVSGDPDKYLRNSSIRAIFFSDDEILATMALTFGRGLGYNNCYAMSGGIDEWKNTVLGSKFTGERITARENALFEARSKASRLFTEFNSLPDSLKIKYLESKKFDPRKLDGGCE